MSHEMNATSIIGDTNGDKLAKKSFKEKMTDLKEAITVEPIVACYQMAISLSKPALDNLEFEKSCRVNLEYNDTICNAILSGNRGDYEEENARVQTVISVMHSWQQPIGSFMPLVLVLFLGSFSDRHKLRKPFLLMPIIGEIFGNAGCIICVIFMRQLPLQAQGVLQKVVPSFFGGQVMLVMASTSHIADVTSNEARTLRLGIVQIVISVTVLLVQPLSGFIFVKSGYLSVLITAALLNTAALMYCAFWIREKSCASQDTEKSILIDVFNPEHALDTFKFPFKKNPGNDRILIGLFILTVFVYRCAYEGESSLLFLYTQNMFEWTPLEFSYFLTANSLVSLIVEMDSESTATSVDENTENFCDNPTRDTIAEGLMGLIKPTVDQLVERVRATRLSQLELKQAIDSLAEELKKISAQQTSRDLDSYVRKLLNAKQRVVVLSNVLQNAQERLNKVHLSIDKEVVKRKMLLNNTVEDCDS
ncbi:uncharacterized protein LOC132695879 isoform X4 [Cylas formicarius]|uniref:uncharacterized protein LOC132695879 isoform X4 n=1 Tax=Cylas formicarius TaxID=197179 RepID=UPI0029583950|nr:uncharacterized protein LOC132695879 isoform X4 [Cylas formicarius]